MCEFNGAFSFLSPESAQVAMNALVPGLPSDCTFEKSVHGSKLHVHIKDSTPRNLQRAINGVLEQLHLIVRTIAAFDIVQM